MHQNDVCGGQVFNNEPSHYWKEVHYFDQRYEGNGIQFYSKRFEHCLKDQKDRIGDATPAYLRYAQRVFDTYTHPKAPRGLVKELKLIVILREPVARELSWYNHKVTKVTNGEGTWIHNDVIYSNGTIKSFDEYAIELSRNITLNPESAYGFYINHLKVWVNLFSRRQLLVLSYSELLENPSKVQWRIERFLESNMTGTLFVSNTKKSPHKVKKLSAVAVNALEPIFQSKNEELYDFLRKYPGPEMEQSPFPMFLVK